MPLTPTQKAGIFAAAVGGTLLFAGRKTTRKCKDFEGVWSSKGASGGLHLTKETRTEAFTWTRSHVASLLVSGDKFSNQEITLDLANHIQECDWEKAVDTKRGKQVWNSLWQIVNSVLEEAAMMGEDQFIKSYGGL